MKKNILLKIGALALASALTVPMFASCGDDPTGGQKPSGGAGNANASHELNIYSYAAGYGDGWIQKAADTFCEKYTDYKVNIYSDAGMFEKLKQELNNDTCEADVALISDTDYRVLAANGKLADLTGLMNEDMPDHDMKIKDAIPEAHIEFRRLGAGDSAKWYGIPWQDNCANGVVYNKKFFDEHNLEIPETMTEFFALCDQILGLSMNTDASTSNDVAPLVYCGANDGYVMNTCNQWFIEYYGYDYMVNTFHKYDTWENHKNTETGRQKAYDTLARLLWGAKNGKSYALSGSNAMTAKVAQQRFIAANPKAAMYICGSWLPTEEASRLDGLGDKFQYGFFGMPHINNNKKDNKGNDSSNVRYSLGSNSLVVPSRSDEQEGAKLFLKELYSLSSLEAFVQENTGISRPMTFTPELEIDTTTNKGAFSKQVYDYYKGTEDKPTKMVYEISTAKMAGILAPTMFGGAGEHIVTNIINAGSLAKARQSVNGAAARETEKVKGYWDFSANNWKATYLN
ncbi:MAG: extracellular solute-binding protein [Clostridiales bacterium]|nr:extracellular solute-binding protein [Clostridiales bacterium]